MDELRSRDDITGGIESQQVSLAPGLKMMDITDFVYVRCNIPGPGTRRSKFEAKFEGCNCRHNTSCDSTCVCIARFGQAYDSMRRLIIVNPYSEKMTPLYECNRACKCPVSCANRVVQNGTSFSFQIFQTELKGYGLKTMMEIPKNSFVCEYAGEILSQEVAKKRTKSQGKNQANYILVLKEHTSEGELRTHIDPTYIGNVGRFINHSCEPNLYMVPVRVNCDIPAAALFAIRDIHVGEELSYDYSGTVQVVPVDDPKSAKGAKSARVLKRQERILQQHESSCVCGSKICRGVLPFDRALFGE